MIYFPEEDLGDLFAAVQIARIFPDCKTFVDAAPKHPPEVIAKRYQISKDAPNFCLKSFVLEHFDKPVELPEQRMSTPKCMRSHLHKHWKCLVRESAHSARHSTLIPLPNPYVVPGGRFREMFYWDSYFTIIGLLESSEDELAMGMIENFASLIDTYGYVPNGNRTYFLGRSQPPFFAAILRAYAGKHGIDSVLQFYSPLEKEYAYWMDDNVDREEGVSIGKHLVGLENGMDLNRYYGEREAPRTEAYAKEVLRADTLSASERPRFYRHLRAACESGWDFSSRWWGERNSQNDSTVLDILPVDLNSLMYQLETTLSLLASHLDLKNDHKFYSARAAQRKTAINHLHFDEDSATYRDYNFREKNITSRLSLAMLFPLFAGVAEQTHADAIAQCIANHFLKAGGLVTTLYESGEQWDSPNGWAPLQYIAVIGLLKYGHQELAQNVASRWLSLNEKVYRAEGKLMEKYNVINIDAKAGGGEYPNQDGFGWTNGVNLFFYALLDRSF